MRAQKSLIIYEFTYNTLDSAVFSQICSGQDAEQEVHLLRRLHSVTELYESLLVLLEQGRNSAT